MYLKKYDVCELFHRSEDTSDTPIGVYWAGLAKSYGSQV
jgi:hypothetical protein